MSKKHLPVHERVKLLEQAGRELGIHIHSIHARPSLNNANCVEIVLDATVVSPPVQPYIGSMAKFTITIKESSKCDCGGEKTGTGHSAWCSKKQEIS